MIAGNDGLDAKGSELFRRQGRKRDFCWEDCFFLRNIADDRGIAEFHSGVIVDFRFVNGISECRKFKINGRCAGSRGIREDERVRNGFP